MRYRSSAQSARGHLSCTSLPSLSSASTPARAGLGGCREGAKPVDGTAWMGKIQWLQGAVGVGMPRACPTLLWDAPLRDVEQCHQSSAMSA